MSTAFKTKIRKIIENVNSVLQGKKMRQVVKHKEKDLPNIPRMREWIDNTKPTVVALASNDSIHTVKYTLSDDTEPSAVKYTMNAPTKTSHDQPESIRGSEGVCPGGFSDSSAPLSGPSLELWFASVWTVFNGCSSSLSTPESTRSSNFESIIIIWQTWTDTAPWNY